MEFVETVISFLDFVDIPALVEASADFSIRLIEEASKIEDSHILFMALECDQFHFRKILEVACSFFMILFFLIAT